MSEDQKKECTCACEQHKKPDCNCAVWAFLLALAATALFLLFVNSASQHKPKEYPKRTTAQLQEQKDRQERNRQAYYVMGQQDTPPRFDKETVEAMQLRCKVKGYQFLRVDWQRRITFDKLAFCLAHPGDKNQRIVALGPDLQEYYP